MRDRCLSGIQPIKGIVLAVHDRSCAHEPSRVPVLADILYVYRPPRGIGGVATAERVITANRCTGLPIALMERQAGRMIDGAVQPEPSKVIYWLAECATPIRRESNWRVSGGPAC